jgi:hypothetical protein
MKFTIAWIVIKVLDYISTILNFSLVGDHLTEANPLMRSLFDKGYGYPIFVIFLSAIIFGLIERRYKESRTIRFSLGLFIALTSLVVLSNFSTYFYGLWILS